MEEIQVMISESQYDKYSRIKSEDRPSFEKNA